MDVAPNDKVSDVMRRIACDNDCDMYVTCDGKVLKNDDELKSCGVRDGSAVQVVSKLRSGGKHKYEKSKSEKKKAASSKEVGTFAETGGGQVRGRAEEQRRVSQGH